MQHILEDKVFSMIKESMLDVPTLKANMPFFRGDYRADQKRVEWKLMRLDKKLQEIDKQKKRIIDSYISGQISQEEYAKQNTEIDQELLQTKFKKEQLLQTIPLLHQKEIVDVSIRQFCDGVKVRLEKCRDFDSKRQFLLDYIDQIIYRKDKVVVVGSVSVRLGERSESNDANKIQFRIESDLSKKEFHIKKRAQYLVDGRLREWGSGGRHAESYKVRMTELQHPKIKASQITQKIVKRDLRDGYISYTAKSYLQHQEEWDSARETLIKNITNESVRGRINPIQTSDKVTT